MPPRKVLCPTDFSDPSYKALETARQLADRFSAELVLIHVVGPFPPPGSPHIFDIHKYSLELTDSATKSLEELVKERFSEGAALRYTVLKGNPPDEIVRMAQEEGIDVIVIATHGSSEWPDLLFGSVTDKVVRMAPCPVLTVPAKGGI